MTAVKDHLLKGQDLEQYVWLFTPSGVTGPEIQIHMVLRQLLTMCLKGQGLGLGNWWQGSLGKNVWRETRTALSRYDIPPRSCLPLPTNPELSMRQHGGAGGGGGGGGGCQC